MAVKLFNAAIDVTPGSITSGYQGVDVSVHVPAGTYAVIFRLRPGYGAHPIQFWPDGHEIQSWRGSNGAMDYGRETFFIKLNDSDSLAYLYLFNDPDVALDLIGYIETEFDAKLFDSDPKLLTQWEAGDSGWKQVDISAYVESGHRPAGVILLNADEHFAFIAGARKAGDTTENVRPTGDHDEDGWLDWDLGETNFGLHYCACDADGLIEVYIDGYYPGFSTTSDNRHASTVTPETNLQKYYLLGYFTQDANVVFIEDANRPADVVLTTADVFTDMTFNQPGDEGLMVQSHGLLDYDYTWTRENGTLTDWVGNPLWDGKTPQETVDWTHDVIKVDANGTIEGKVSDSGEGIEGTFQPVMLITEPLDIAYSGNISITTYETEGLLSPSGSAPALTTTTYEATGNIADLGSGSIALTGYITYANATNGFPGEASIATTGYAPETQRFIEPVNGSVQALTITPHQPVGGAQITAKLVATIGAQPLTANATEQFELTATASVGLAVSMDLPSLLEMTAHGGASMQVELPGLPTMQATASQEMLATFEASLFRLELTAHAGARANVELPGLVTMQATASTEGLATFSGRLLLPTMRSTGHTGHVGKFDSRLGLLQMRSAGYVHHAGRFRASLLRLRMDAKAQQDTLAKFNASLGLLEMTTVAYQDQTAVANMSLYEMTLYARAGTSGRFDGDDTGIDDGILRYRRP